MKQQVNRNERGPRPRSHRVWMGAPHRPAPRIAVVAAAVVLGAVGCGSDPPPAPDPARMPPTRAVQRYLAEVYPILEAKCIDCHHSDVDPPWYAALPVVGQRIERDVVWGRQRLDVSLPYPFLDPERADRLGGRAYLHALRTAVLDQSMPPRLYRVLHPLSALSEDEERILLDWVDEALAEWVRPAASAAVAYRVSDLFRNRCARCHIEGVHEDMNGAFDFVSDLEFLADDEDYVVAEDAEGSPLFERLTDDADPMPPSPNDRLGEEEVELVRRWIDEGADLP